ncbi:hypothetical protein BSLA_03r1489 [Burkholderia stabilis]|nr:hypothetical protein BSLA_03r1489 [Burkholderia stabilis]
MGFTETIAQFVFPNAFDRPADLFQRCHQAGESDASRWHIACY